MRVLVANGHFARASSSSLSGALSAELRPQ